MCAWRVCGGVGGVGGGGVGGIGGGGGGDGGRWWTVVDGGRYHDARCTMPTMRGGLASSARAVRARSSGLRILDFCMPGLWIADCRRLAAATGETAVRDHRLLFLLRPGGVGGRLGRHGVSFARLWLPMRLFFGTPPLPSLTPNGRSMAQPNGPHSSPGAERMVGRRDPCSKECRRCPSAWHRLGQRVHTPNRGILPTSSPPSHGYPVRRTMIGIAEQTAFLKTRVKPLSCRPTACSHTHVALNQPATWGDACSLIISTFNMAMAPFNLGSHSEYARSLPREQEL